MTGPLKEWCWCSGEIKNFNKILCKATSVDLSPWSTLVLTQKGCGDLRGRKETAFFPFSFIASGHRFQIQAALKYLCLPGHNELQNITSAGVPGCALAVLITVFQKSLGRWVWLSHLLILFH